MAGRVHGRRAAAAAQAATRAAYLPYISPTSPLYLPYISGYAGSYARCASVGRALVISVGARREAGAAAELCDAREALRLLGYSVITVANPTASELAASLMAHASQARARVRVRVRVRVRMRVRVSYPYPYP